MRRTAATLLLPLAAALLVLDAVTHAGGEEVSAPGKYFGASTCDSSSCHSRATPRKDAPFLQEHTTWSALDGEGQPQDRHAYAFKRLRPKAKGGDDRSAAITAKLNEIEKTTDGAEASARCLTCHGVAVADFGVGKKNAGAAVAKTAALQGKTYRALDGVSCDGCHGPAEKRLTPHDRSGWAANEWKKLGGKAGGSEKLYDTTGLYFSKDLELWANQCIRCHLAIDANLLDAGHPDLNAFELFFQSQSMPIHWRDYTKAKPAPELPGAGPMHAALLWQTGQVAALRSALEQLVGRAKAGKHVAPAIERAKAHWTALRPALKRIAPEDATVLDENFAKLDEKIAGELAANMLPRVGPLVRKAADHAADLEHVKAVMKALASDGGLLASAGAAQQGAWALYALNYSRLAQTDAIALAADPPTDAAMKAIYSMLGSPDPSSDAFKKGLEDLKRAVE